MIDNQCNQTECEYYRDGECLDAKTLKDPHKATGCLVYKGCNHQKQNRDRTTDLAHVKTGFNADSLTEHFAGNRKAAKQYLKGCYFFYNSANKTELRSNNGLFGRIWV